ncbi:MAG: hypothetical protein K9J37_18805 [Saprospiraceae bacterium]|nr:hypothetical protein [Saprospiraceae bacterium]MCF8251973.1 hypothetical protein [Saprospiraceae bacterium]MCF8281692.1 hypothetical protein [Bacteroidales bacterium]MCF8313680.1 hypothetical protein [Saprospiraceae bacterium]MCF8442387.1 hypothetical protein [Saprospiraceae bacterium]
MPSLRDEILQEHSKAQTMRIVRNIGDDQAAFDELMSLVLCNELKAAQRAAWVMSFCVEQHPHLAYPHLESLVKNLRNTHIHDAVKRNTAKILEFLPIPEALIGEAVDILFQFVANPKETVAVRVFSMSALFNLCKNEPDLLEELRLTIEDLMPHGTAGMRSRGKKVLKDISKALGK